FGLCYIISKVIKSKNGQGYLGIETLQTSHFILLTSNFPGLILTQQSGISPPFFQSTTLLLLIIHHSPLPVAGRKKDNL
ncbi:MAG: hypothetical protein WBN16_06995, partial [Lutimonas sp.]